MGPSNIENPITASQPVQPPVPTIDPIPTPIVPNQTPPVVQSGIPVVQTVVNPASTGGGPVKTSPLRWVILAIVFFFILVGVGVIILFLVKPKNSVTQNNTNGQHTYTPIVVPTETPKPVTLAPPGTTDFALQYWRTKRATVTEAQQIGKEVGSVFGEILIPSDLQFIHEEVYKGIPIKWTAGQPISEARLAWLKSAIDKTPPLLITDHPITGVFSATLDELKITDGLNKSRLGIASAYASGLNIFLTNNILIDKAGYVPLKETEFMRVFFHEWTHVIQYYEALQTFTDTYLKIPGNAVIATRLVPFVKDFAKTGGWDYGDDTYADITNPHLKSDVESQKTSDYGKGYEYEDQAETLSSFLTCQTSDYSQARIQWVEKVTNTTAASYCK